MGRRVLIGPVAITAVGVLGYASADPPNTHRGGEIELAVLITRPVTSRQGGMPARSAGGGSGVSWAPNGATVYFGQDNSTAAAAHRVGETSSRGVGRGLPRFTAMLAVDG